MEIGNVKGTQDIYLSKARSFQKIEDHLRCVVESFGFNEFRPPVIENSQLFRRATGESSDVVRKEMYDFKDKGDRDITLRPEFTAGIIRAYVGNKLYATMPTPMKAYYYGPVFRYERPQLGRYRQFEQFGVETIGVDSYLRDVEVIHLCYTCFVSLGLENVTIKVNSLGDEESRNNYKKALVEYFTPHIRNMCPDCQSRLLLNPLRILDCKVEEDRKIIEGAPKMSDYLTESAKERFENVKSMLDGLGIPYEVDDSLVRGLDYYSETVFEFHYTSKKGLNYGAIGAGGHYGNLVGEIGGPKDMEGVGFSFGIERIHSVLTDDEILVDEDNPLDIYVMPIGEDSQSHAFLLASHLRLQGYATEIALKNEKMGRMFTLAEQKKAKIAIIVGENEINTRRVVVKDLEKKEQTEVAIEDLVNYLDDFFGESESCHCGCHCDDECECGCHDGACSCECECHESDCGCKGCDCGCDPDCKLRSEKCPHGGKKCHCCENGCDPKHCECECGNCQFRNPNCPCKDHECGCGCNEKHNESKGECCCCHKEK